MIMISRPILVATLVSTACGFTGNSVGKQITGMNGDTGTESSSTGDDGASGNINPGSSTSASSSTTAPPATTDGDGETSTDVDPVPGLAGAALLVDGLCPWEFGEAPAMTLRFTQASFVCNANLWSAYIDANEYPTWWVELTLPFDEPGTYDLATFRGTQWINQIQPDSGGGGAGGELVQGTITITRVDATSVAGVISGTNQLNVNDVTVEVNGEFEAVRCTASEWLDVPNFDPNDGPDGGFDPACLLPE